MLGESYENALTIELRGNGFKGDRQCPIKVFCMTVPVGEFAADLLVEYCIIIN
jgi:GxxExxY protein